MRNGARKNDGRRIIPPEGTWWVGATARQPAAEPASSVLPTDDELTWVGEFPLEVNWPGGTAQTRCAVFQLGLGGHGRAARHSAAWLVGDDEALPHRFSPPRSIVARHDRRTAGLGLPGAPSATSLDAGAQGAAGAPSSRHWLALARSALAQMEGSGHRLDRPAGHHHTVYLVVAESPSPQDKGVVRSGPITWRRPRALVRAIKAMEADPTRKFSTPELARAANVSVRTLQSAFRRHTGMTPMEYLRQLRLARVHADLLTAEADRVTVGVIAHRWGFSHLGRFAAAYRARYGVNPSTTLRSEPAR